MYAKPEFQNPVLKTHSLTEDKTSKTKDPCRHGGGPTRRRSWIYIYILIINEHVDNGTNVIVTGDWNTAHHEIDLARPKENVKTSGFMPIERERLDRLIEDGYIDTFRAFHSEPEQYSWWSFRTAARKRNIGWRIDYVFVTTGLKSRLEDAFIQQEVIKVKALAECNKFTYEAFKSIDLKYSQDNQEELFFYTDEWLKKEQ